MKWDYTPPRGFTNPFVKTEDAEGEQRIATKESIESKQFGTVRRMRKIEGRQKGIYGRVTDM